MCDQYTKRILVFDTEKLSPRGYIERWNSADDGKFLQPTTVMVHDGKLYIVDSLNHDIQVLAPDSHGQMRFAFSFGGLGYAPGQFIRPWGIEVTKGKRGLLVVSEGSNERMQVLTPTGVPLQVFKMSGIGLRGLCTMCADEYHLWVVNSIDNKVHVLKIGKH